MAYLGVFPEEEPLKTGGFINPIRALNSANRRLRLGLDTSAAYIEAIEGPEPVNFLIKDVAGCVEPARARLVYHVQDGEIFLSWQLRTNVGDDIVRSWVDAWNVHHIIAAVGAIHSFARTDANFFVFPWEVENPNAGPQEMVSNPCKSC